MEKRYVDDFILSWICHVSRKFQSLKVVTIGMIYDIVLYINLKY